MASVDAFNAFEAAAAWETKPVAYGDCFGEITPRVVEPLLDAAGVGPGVRMLDVASGPGCAAGQAASRDASVVGVDIAEAMVSAARERYPQIEFSAGRRGGSCVPGWLVRCSGRQLRPASPGPPRAGRPRARAHPRPRWPACAHGVGPPEQGALSGRAPRCISFSHVASSADELWDGLLAGTVRTAPIVLGQTDEVQLRIRAAFERLVKPYEAGGRLELPVSVNLASARQRES